MRTVVTAGNAPFNRAPRSVSYFRQINENRSRRVRPAVIRPFNKCLINTPLANR